MTKGGPLKSKLLNTLKLNCVERKVTEWLEGSFENGRDGIKLTARRNGKWKVERKISPERPVPSGYGEGGRWSGRIFCAITGLKSTFRKAIIYLISMVSMLYVVRLGRGSPSSSQLERLRSNITLDAAQHVVFMSSTYFRDGPK